MAITIALCTCDSHLGNRTAARFQDEQYGRGRRVFNVHKENGRCSVCGSTRKFEEKKKQEKTETEVPESSCKTGATNSKATRAKRK